MENKNILEDIYNPDYVPERFKKPKKLFDQLMIHFLPKKYLKFCQELQKAKKEYQNNGKFEEAKNQLKTAYRNYYVIHNWDSIALKNSIPTLSGMESLWDLLKYN